MGNPQPSPILWGRFNDYPRGVGPRGPKRLAPLWGDDIVWSLGKLKEEGPPIPPQHKRQEKKAPVFVAATANNVHQLPPELLRKGRFDEINEIGLLVA